jgi:Kef-type K+ transport system membrane component KefB
LLLADILLDVAVFVALPAIAWRLTRRVVPLAVLPILVGLMISVAGHHLGGEPLLRPTEAADLAGWAGVLLLAYVAGLEATTGATDEATPGVSIARLWSWRLLASTATALALPFAAGLLLAVLWLLRLPAWSPPNGDRLAAAFAIGLCLSVSALPVLVAIVRELPASSRALGRLALRVAALSDAVLWLGLGVLLVAIRATDAAHGWGPVDAAAVLVLGALVLGRRWGGRWLARGGARIPAPVAWLIAALFLAGGAWSTSALGLHALIGAYLAGMLMPVAIAQRLPTDRLAFVALAGLAPLFFGHRGLAIDGAVLDGQSLAAAVGLLVVSAAAKIAAIVLVPPSLDLSRRDRLALGTLLQCKGLMEIVAATVLRDHGVLTDTAYAVLIGLAVLSTTATKPLYGWLRRSRAQHPISVSGP